MLFLQKRLKLYNENINSLEEDSKNDQNINALEEENDQNINSQNINSLEEKKLMLLEGDHFHSAVFLFFSILSKIHECLQPQLISSCVPVKMSLTLRLI